MSTSRSQLEDSVPPFDRVVRFLIFPGCILLLIPDSHSEQGTRTSKYLKGNETFEKVSV